MSFFPEHLYDINKACHGRTSPLSKLTREEQTLSSADWLSICGLTARLNKWSMSIFLRWCVLKLNSEWLCNLGMRLTIDFIASNRHGKWALNQQKLWIETYPLQCALQIYTYMYIYIYIHGWQNILGNLAHIKSKKCRMWVYHICIYNIYTYT